MAHGIMATGPVSRSAKGAGIANHPATGAEDRAAGRQAAGRAPRRQPAKGAGPSGAAGRFQSPKERRATSREEVVEASGSVRVVGEL
jgi:hypothetical protein